MLLLFWSNSVFTFCSVSVQSWDDNCVIRRSTIWWCYYCWWANSYPRAEILLAFSSCLRHPSVIRISLDMYLKRMMVRRVQADFCFAFFVEKGYHAIRTNGRRYSSDWWAVILLPSSFWARIVCLPSQISPVVLLIELPRCLFSQDVKPMPDLWAEKLSILY